VDFCRRFLCNIEHFRDERGDPVGPRTTELAVHAKRGAEYDRQDKDQRGREQSGASPQTRAYFVERFNSRMNGTSGRKIRGLTCTSWRNTQALPHMRDGGSKQPPGQQHRPHAQPPAHAQISFELWKEHVVPTPHKLAAQPHACALGEHGSARHDGRTPATLKATYSFAGARDHQPKLHPNPFPPAPRVSVYSLSWLNARDAARVSSNSRKSLILPFSATRRPT